MILYPWVTILPIKYPLTVIVSTIIKNVFIITLLFTFTFHNEDTEKIRVPPEAPLRTLGVCVHSPVATGIV